MRPFFSSSLVHKNITMTDFFSSFFGFFLGRLTDPPTDRLTGRVAGRLSGKDGQFLFPDTQCKIEWCHKADEPRTEKTTGYNDFDIDLVVVVVVAVGGGSKWCGGWVGGGWWVGPLVQ